MVADLAVCASGYNLEQIAILANFWKAPRSRDMTQFLAGHTMLFNRIVLPVDLDIKFRMRVVLMLFVMLMALVAFMMFMLMRLVVFMLGAAMLMLALSVFVPV